MRFVVAVLTISWFELEYGFKIQDVIEGVAILLVYTLILDITYAIGGESC